MAVPAIHIDPIHLVEGPHSPHFLLAQIALAVGVDLIEQRVGQLPALPVLGGQPGRAVQQDVQLVQGRAPAAT